MHRKQPFYIVPLGVITALFALSSLFSGGAHAQSPRTYKDLHDFGGSIPIAGGSTVKDSNGPIAGVTIDKAGNIYGTTGYGGPDFQGNVWEIMQSGAYKDLHDFGGGTTYADGTSGQDGYQAFQPVTIDSEGNIYGVTQAGGEHLDGIVWEIRTDGTYKDLHDFGGSITYTTGTAGSDGSRPSASVTLDPSGNMYGTASRVGCMAPESFGRSPPQECIRTCTTGGTVTNANGASGPDGSAPVSSVTFDSIGNMYGTTSDSGAYSAEFGGIVWEIAASGVYKDLHDFGGTVTKSNGSSGTDGSNPQAGVVLDGAGDIFGTTEYTGVAGSGTVWEITFAGAYSDLHDFGGTINDAGGASGPDGSWPVAGVTFDTAGNMFGTAMMSGARNGGMVWEITASGDYKDLHDFGVAITNANGSSGADGFQPYGGVSIDRFGNIYGTTYEGGPNLSGITWEIAGAASPAPLQPGLQMFSLPYSYPATGLDTIFGYSGVTLAVWSPATSTYALTPTPTADQIRAGQAYWARFPQAIALSGKGTPADTSQNFDIPLTAGWNMIGDPFTVSVPVANLLFDSGTETFAQATTGASALIGATLYTYPAGATQYETATTIQPEQGYWIYAFKNTDMQVPHP